ncbi:MAG: hypothetical protein WC426_06070 [Sulfuriferula sp.]
MALQLSTSDIVAIALAFVQMAVTIGVAIWSMTRASPTKIMTRELTIRTVLKWFRWVTFAFLAFGIYVLWSSATSDEPITKGFLFKSLFYSFSIVINLLAAIVMSLANHFLDRINSALKLIEMQHSHVKLLGELLLVNHDVNVSQGENSPT